jgi:hypothetical protein
MMNSLEVYREAGYKAGEASKRHDQSFAAFQRNWLSRALTLETPEYAQEARKAYDEAYREGSGFYQPRG